MSVNTANSEKHVPRVSVLIPVYNRAEVIAETIQSVLDQTFTDFELLLCDDGSTDRTVEVIESFDDPRIRLIRNEKNMGSSATRNRLNEEARGEYCAILDSDDIAYDYRLQVQVDFLDSHPDVDMCSGTVVIVDGDGRETGRRWYAGSQKHEELKVLSLFRCNLAQTALMFRREKFLLSGLYYMPGPANDVGMFTKAVHKLVFENMDIPLVKYRIWDTQMSADNASQNNRAMEHIGCQYDMLGIELTSRDKEVLLSLVGGGTLPPELASAFRDLSFRMLAANREKRIFDNELLVVYFKTVYKKMLGKLSGFKNPVQFLTRYLGFPVFKAKLNNYKR